MIRKDQISLEIHWLLVEMKHLVFFVHRAADWDLPNPSWTGRLRVCAKGKSCYIKIEDKTSGKRMVHILCR